MRSPLALNPRSLHQFARWFVTSVAWCLILQAGCDSPARHDGPVVTSGAADKTTPNEAAEEPPLALDQLINLGQAALQRGDVQAAEKAFREVLTESPQNVAALFGMASVNASEGDAELAIELLHAIPHDDAQYGIRAFGMAADLCLKVGRTDEALEKYLQLTRWIPASSAAHRQVAYILNCLGRRHEAARHTRVLCKLGDIRQDELHSLMVLSDAVYDPPSDQAESIDRTDAASSPNSERRKYFPLGPSGLARKHFTDLRYHEAADLLEPMLKQPEVPSTIRSFYGRCLIEGQRDREFISWLQEAPRSCQEDAEYWAALGAWLVEEARFREAVRALAEAIVRDPTDARSYRRMNQSLIALGEVQTAQTWDERYQTLRTVTLASNRLGESVNADEQAFDEVVNGLLELHRPLESLLWNAIAQFHRQADQEVLAELNEKRKQLVDSQQAFPSQQERVCQMNIQAYPLLQRIAEASVPSSPMPDTPRTEKTAATPRFENVAERWGLEHTYRVSAVPQRSGFSIYQMMGGGVAVLDYDLDGSSDLYFSQGACDPPEKSSEHVNQLYRQHSDSLHDVTSFAGVGERRYSTGVTAGDWNQDGFPDIVVANLGTDSLFINNGDGTFRYEPTDDLDDPTRVRSSIAMADLTGDHLPDVFEQNYVHDADFSKRPTINAEGYLRNVAPGDYQPAMDRMFINDASGGRIPKEMSPSADDRSTGLGVIVGNFDAAPGNEIFVGNDVNPNQLWVREGPHQWRDIAHAKGLALGHDGFTTASMGIAAGDFDGSGTIDLHVTNFENVPARLFLSRAGTFQDRAIAMGIAKDSSKVLGFGTQSIDYDNDGYCDLVVTNGHVEDTGVVDSPFAQLAQVFRNHGDGFELTPVVDPSGYFHAPHVGRALARLDLNRDGRQDFVVTHLEAPSALLVNRTKTSNHWLRLKLVGVDSERDAVGAEVVVSAGPLSWTHWALAGDGYLCRNEQFVAFGLGEVDHLDAIEIRWPSGKVQTFRDVDADREWVAVENDDALFALQ